MPVKVWRRSRAEVRRGFGAAMRDSACRSVRAVRRQVIYVRRMHIEHTAVIVDDYDSAISFYVQALGLGLVEDSPSLSNDGRAKRWVVMRPPGAATGLLLAHSHGDRKRTSRCTPRTRPILRPSVASMCGPTPRLP